MSMVSPHGDGGEAASFADAVRVHAIAEGRYAAVIDPAWSIGETPNGGYTLAIAQHALADALPHPNALTITGHFLAAPSAGPIDIEVSPLRIGRTLSRGSARLLQDGREFLRAVVAFGHLSNRDEAPALYDATPPDLPPPDRCRAVRATTPDGRPALLRDQLDIRYHPESVRWLHGVPSGRAHVSAWVRPRAPYPPDSHLSTLLVDSLPSAAFELGLHGWIPTVELTVHHRAKPVPGWLRCVFRSRIVSHGLVEEDGEIWDESDRIVAMSRQLSLAPTDRAS